MRRMKNEYGVVNVVEWIQTSNFWEYYITDQKDADNNDIVFAVVMGFVTEMGDISLAEIAPYIRIRTKDLSKLAPAEGYSWVEDKKEKKLIKKEKTYDRQ